MGTKDRAEGCFAYVFWRAITELCQTSALTEDTYVPPSLNKNAPEASFLHIFSRKRLSVSLFKDDALQQGLWIPSYRIQFLRSFWMIAHPFGSCSPIGEDTTQHDPNGNKHRARSSCVMILAYVCLTLSIRTGFSL